MIEAFQAAAVGALALLHGNATRGNNCYGVA